MFGRGGATPGGPECRDRTLRTRATRWHRRLSTWTPTASVGGFDFTELLKFRLRPRLKNIGSIRPYGSDDGRHGYPALGGSLTRAVTWDLVAWARGS